MQKNRDWIWNIIACPECGNVFVRDENGQFYSCANSACQYRFERNGRILNLLPLSLDNHQKAENEFRVNYDRKSTDSFPWMDKNQLSTLKMLDYLTSYWVSSTYKFFREDFSTRYKIRGRGLEIGGATGHSSGYLKLFNPGIEIITSDIAPYNIILAERIAKFVGFETDYFVMADAERMPFLQDSFDFIFSSGMLHHLGDLQLALQKGRSALKPDGRWYIINELSIGSIPRMYWNSNFGKKGKHAVRTGIRENSYTFKEWKNFFESGGFKIIDIYFHTNPNHKLLSWSLSCYYAIISRIPTAFIKLGIPCEVCFVLEKK